MSRDFSAVPKYRAFAHDGYLAMERRVDVKNNGVWLDYFWEDTGDTCETQEEVDAYLENALSMEEV